MTNEVAELYLDEEEKKLQSEQVLLWAGLAVAMINAISAALVFSRIQPEIPLFYSLNDVNQQLVDKKFIFLLPIIGLLIVITHWLIIKIGSKNTKTVLWRLLAVVTLVLQILILAINWRIIIIVN